MRLMLAVPIQVVTSPLGPGERGSGSRGEDRWQRLA